MKKTNFLLFLPGIILVIVLLGCGKGTEYPVPSTPLAATPAPPPPPPPPAKNEPPVVDAGFQQFIFLPINQTKLKTYIYDKETPDKLKYAWRKITGSDRLIIDSPGIAQPTLLNLEKGFYEFEVIAIDPDSLMDKDKVTITVIDAVGEYLFPKLDWYCPWGCHLSMEVRIAQLPAFKLFIKTEVTGANWFEVPKSTAAQAATSKFMYEFDKTELLIYSDYELGLTELKIVF